ncbi:hypothetical protein [Vibrio sp. TBV020]|uniref:hypothetical protein n=1 Tax=Vibrio sp. TBV020 TaxID=3137398 RepID=UPI0038CD2F3D
MTIVLPLFIPGALTIIFTGVMRLSDVRVEFATVYNKEPYNVYAKEFGIQGDTSSFWDSFIKFEKAQVLFKGIGSNTVLSWGSE